MADTPKKGNLFTSGSEEHLELIKADARGEAMIEGGAIPYDPKQVQPLEGFKAPLPNIGNDVNAFKAEIRNWLFSWEYIVRDSFQLASRYLQIYHSFKQTIIDRAVVLLEGYEPWQHLKFAVEQLRFDPSRDINLIKYCVFYLKSIYEDVCQWLDNPEAGYFINRPDLIRPQEPPTLDPRAEMERKMEQARQAAQYKAEQDKASRPENTRREEPSKASKDDGYGEIF